MTDPDILRSNARIREVASGLGRLATTLLTAAAAKAYLDRTVGLAVVGWLVAVAILIWVAWLVLSLLEPEK